VKLYRPLVLVLMFASWSTATAMAGGLSVGAKAGLITTSVTGIPKEWEDSKSYRTSFVGGIVLNYAIDEAFSLQPELLYVPKGLRGTLYDGIISVDVTPSFDFLEMPILAKYTFPTGGKWHPCVFAGPSFAYALSSKLKISAGWLATSIDISSLTNDTEFGIVAGTGFGYETGRGLLTFDVRYERGFTNIIKSGEVEFLGSTQTISIDEFKNYGFAFLVGYQF
jgi:hypothetical protein